MKRYMLLLLAIAVMTAGESPFTMVIQTNNPGTSGSSEFTLPLAPTSNYNFTIDWGDGTSESITSSSSPTHAYASSGTKTVQIWKNATGGFPRIYFNNGGDCQKLTQITQWGSVDWVSMAGAFYGCSRLVITATDEAKAQTRSVTDFSSAWDGCSSLTSFPRLNTSAGTDFSNTWRFCSGLTSFPLLNTGAGTDFNHAWYNCSSLTSFPLLNTGAGTNFSYAWYACVSLASFPLLNTNAGTNFTGSWGFCSGLTSFPLLNTSAGTNFDQAWYHCSGLTSFPVLNTGSGTNFSYAWLNCSGLTSFPLLNTSAGTNFSGAWQDCSGLTSFPLLNTSAGTVFSGAWRYCYGLTIFPTLNLGNMSYGYSCFEGVTLTPESYSNVLADLAARNIQTGVTFDGGLSTYYPTVVDARDTTLRGGRGWTITDGGVSGSSDPGSPLVTSAATARATTGTAFSYRVTATHEPYAFAATGLPAGLVIDTATGVISGTATAAGYSLVTVFATNWAGTGQRDVTVHIAAATNSGGSSSGCGAGAIGGLIIALGLLGLRRRRGIVAAVVIAPCPPRSATTAATAPP